MFLIKPTVIFGGMASLFLGCSLVSLVEIICAVYKWLMMLKRRHTKVHMVSEQQSVILNRRNTFYRFRKPLYQPPSNKSQTVNKY